MSNVTAGTQAARGADGPKVLALGDFGSIRSEEVDWISFPAYPPQVKLAILVGDPRAGGPVCGAGPIARGH